MAMRVYHFLYWKLKSEIIFRKTEKINETSKVDIFYRSYRSAYLEDLHILTKNFQFFAIICHQKTYIYTCFKLYLLP